MTRADMDRVKADFVRATLMGEEAGFDMLELHCGHGYLLSSFLTPVSNQRTDEYGGSVENRLRFPLEVFDAMRAAWPKHKPMSVRISATDWCDDGLSAEDSIAIAQAFAQRRRRSHRRLRRPDHAATRVPSTAACSRRPSATAFATRARVRTMAVGNIFEPDHVNSILAAGRADLCALARPHLMDPNWTLRAAAELGWQRARAASAISPGLRADAAQPRAQSRGAAMNDLAGKHAFITGGGTGIGLASARALAARGAQAHARRDATSPASNRPRPSSTRIAVSVDVANETSVTAAFEAARATLRRRRTSSSTMPASRRRRRCTTWTSPCGTRSSPSI